MDTLLPPELLVRIFKDLRNMFAQPSETEPHELDALKWLPVNRVCRSWRQAALGDPTLWTHISMWDDNFDCVRTFVERSRPQLLYVRVPVGLRKRTETNNRTVLRLVMGEAYRVRHLEVGWHYMARYGNRSSLNKMCNVGILCLCAFPSLQELCLRSVDIERTSLVALLAACPQLRKLVIMVDPWGDDTLRPTVEMWCDALEEMPHLEHLLLEHAFGTGLEQIHGGEYTRSPLRLDNLRTLSIHYPPLQQSAWFFRSLSIPSTASMQVKYNGSENIRQDIACAFAAIAACRSRNKKCKLISLDLDECSGAALEVSCWDTALQMPLCSGEPSLLTEDMRTHLLLRISLDLMCFSEIEDRYGHYMEISDMLQNAFIFTDAVSLRIGSRWFEQDTDEPGTAGLASLSTQEYRTVCREMNHVKTLAISGDVTPQQINCMLGMDPGRPPSAAPFTLQCPPLFPRLEELTLHNMCLWPSWEVPSDIPYDQVLRAVDVRKALGCGIRSLRIWDIQDGELDGPVYAQLRAAVPELDVQRSSTCPCHSSKA
ncbi:hypothetical protein NM688_g6482 [Phlebia brevispora]|uniref:Uncharacterized protein n=1 Tax=Phlebia brevispora TaxID=194682 RepID=A0ACC1SFK2_9APHY|nr:hypothetical protein NM688_g6482 [Phlebia brevispora]